MMNTKSGAQVRSASICLAVGGVFFAMMQLSCGGRGDDEDAGGDDTSQVGTFDGLFDDVASGINFPFDIAIAPDDPDTDDVEAGDLYVAGYGTSEVYRVDDPSGEAMVGNATPFFDGGAMGFLGTTAVSMSRRDQLWAAFEQGGATGQGALVRLSDQGDVTLVLEDDAAFSHPGGLCSGGRTDGDDGSVLFMVNLGDGSVWRVTVPDDDIINADFVRVATGLASGAPGAPGTAGNGINNQNELPQGGARGCAYAGGDLFVADAQNARVVRIPDALTVEDGDVIALEDTPDGLVTYPTGVSVNDAGDLIVISNDNAKAFVALDLPSGGFVDNGLHDLNVNSGNYGVAVAHDTIWFTRANNSSGTLRALTEAQDVPPSTAGPFPLQ